MPVLGQEVTMIQGEDLALNFVHEGSNFDVSSWALRWQLHAMDGDGIPVINKDNRGQGGLWMTTPKYGVFEVVLRRPDTMALTLQNTPWYWELRRFDPGRSTCLAKGTMIIKPFNAAPI